MKSVVLCAMMAAASLLLASPAAARDPFVGISVLEETTDGGDGADGLQCCNICRCDRSWGWCTCKDVNSYTLGCTPGCEDCRCSLWPTSSCVCGDMIRRCPESCGMRQTSSATDRGTAADPAQAINAAATA